MQSTTAKRRRLLIAGAAGVIALGVGVLLMPHAPRLSSETIGDPELIAHLADTGRVTR